MKVLDLLGKALGIEAEEVNNLFGKGMQSVRMNYYPPCPQPELVMGLCPHSDACALAILLQVNETDGLQIRKDGIWIPVLPLPNAFIVNVGDSLEVLSPFNFHYLLLPPPSYFMKVLGTFQIYFPQFQEHCYFFF